VEGDPELVCPWVVDMERSPPSTSASANWNILHLFQVSLKGKGKESLPAHPWLPLSFLISSHLCFYSVCFGVGARIRLCCRRSRLRCRRWRISWCRCLFGKMSRVSSLRLPSSIKGELAEVHLAREVVEEKFCSLFDASADGVQRLVVSKMECQEQFEELSLLRV
jgi:hypothetical protein